MTETPVLFGSESRLVGIITEPVTTNTTNLACVTFNSGVIPRLGPHRFNVKLARDLATAGIMSMRFDISGLGDSRPASGAGNFLQQAVSDIRSAMDLLEQRYGVHRYVLIGNCSGAVQVYWASLADQRVVGSLMFDGFCFRTRWTPLVRQWKLLRARTWKSVLAALGRRLALALRLRSRKQVPAEASMFSDDDSYATPPRDKYCKAIQSLVDRGVSVFLVYSGGSLDCYSYANQFRDFFSDQPFVDKVRCDHMPDIDHTLLMLKAQQGFIDVIRTWIDGIARSEAKNAK